MTKMGLVVETALVGALVACAIPIGGQVRALRSRANLERAIATANGKLSFRSTAGIDVSGRLVHESLPAGATRFVAFGLRDSTLRADMSLWSSVAALLSAEPTVYLIGYCASTICAESVRRVNGPLAFTVLSYCEVVAAQAVLNADADGTLLLFDGRMKPLRSIRWRTPGMPVEEIVREVLR